MLQHEWIHAALAYPISAVKYMILACYIELSWVIHDMRVLYEVRSLHEGQVYNIHVRNVMHQSQKSISFLTYIADV